MITPNLFHQLRAAQSRSAYEQQLLSGREWILVAGLVQFFTALFPLYVWINHSLFDLAPLHSALHPAAYFGISLALSAGLLLLWAWAHFAPFRAALVALLVYVACQAVIGLIEPRVLMSGALVKSVVLLGLLHAARTGYLRHRAL
ncbi:MAG TPA: hypothetical protein VGD81_20560 [Opitutaceae bacterium]